MKRTILILAALMVIPSMASAQYVVAGAAPAPAPQPRWQCPSGACPTSYFQVSVDAEGSMGMGGAQLKLGYGWGTTALNNMISFVIGGHSTNDDANNDYPLGDFHIGVAYDLYKPLHWSPWFRLGLTVGGAGGLGIYDDEDPDTLESVSATGVFAQVKAGFFISWLPGPLAHFNWYSGEWEYFPNYLELFVKADYNVLPEAIGAMDSSTYVNMMVGLNVGWWFIFW